MGSMISIAFKGRPTDVAQVYKNVSIFHGNRDQIFTIDKSSMEEFFASVEVKHTDPNYFVGLDEVVQKHFPPTYVVTCDVDSLRADGTVLVGSLQSNGVEVKHDHYSGLPHCFWIFPTLPETEKFLENLSRVLNGFLQESWPEILQKKSEGTCSQGRTLFTSMEIADLDQHV